MRIGWRLGLASSTVYRVLCRLGLNRLAWLDRPTGRVIRRLYEHPRPGDLLHIDVKKLGRIPPGGGWRAHGRGGDGHGGHSRVGYAYIHSAVDDHSRVAYSEVLADERAVTAVAFWQRARSWFAERGVSVRAVLTDNGSCYRSADFARACLAAGVRHRRTRPYRPQTNGKVERFNRTLLEEWAYVRVYRSEPARTARACPLAASLQSSPLPHRPQRPPADQPCNQPPCRSQLDALSRDRRPSPPSRGKPLRNSPVVRGAALIRRRRPVRRRRAAPAPTRAAPAPVMLQRRSRTNGPPPQGGPFVDGSGDEQ